MPTAVHAASACELRQAAVLLILLMVSGCSGPNTHRLSSIAVQYNGSATACLPCEQGATQAGVCLRVQRVQGSLPFLRKKSFVQRISPFVYIYAAKRQVQLILHRGCGT